MLCDLTRSMPYLIFHLTHFWKSSLPWCIGKQSTCVDEQAAAEDTGPSFAAAMGAAPLGGALIIGGTAAAVVGGAAFSVDNNGKGTMSP